MAEQDFTANTGSMSAVSLSLNQQDAIEHQMGDLKTLVSVLVAASTGNDEFDLAGFALMMEDKFAELHDTYEEATGSERRYERYPAK